ncbi:MAG: Hsp70 family protein [Anaerolineae bacterium]|nr:Hsp70 family protein [Anaerolineae bacterium]
MPKSKNGDAWVVMGGKEYSPPEISAMICRSSRPMPRPTCEPETDGHQRPAYFNDSQRQATKDAAKLPVSTFLRVITNPPHLTPAYGWTRREDEKSLPMTWMAARSISPS